MRTRTLLLALAAFVIAGVLLWRVVPHTSATPTSGGTLVATIRSEPRSLNRLVTRDRVSQLVSLLLHARLVRLNLATQDVEPALAERWELGADGKTYTFHLRHGVLFSDGTPFTARDVVFTFRALSDPKVGSSLASVLEVAGTPPTVSSVDDHTVRITFGAPFAPALRALDAVPILPAHKLEAALEAGTFRDAWPVTTPPADLAGLGPFVLREYAPGVRLSFEANPRYWKKDPDGTALPRVQRLTLDVVPDQNAEMLRLEAGETDLVSSEVRPEDISTLRKAAADGRVRIEEAGIGLDPDMLWFNLRPGAAGSDRAWLTRPELREAISLGVDRQAFVDVVYLGAGTVVDGPITPGNRRWFDPSRPSPARDPVRAGQLLDSLGLSDRDGDGQRETPGGGPARFTILSQKGNAVRERGAAFLQQELRKMGLGVDIVSLDAGGLGAQIDKGGYEAAWFGVVSGDTDPGSNLDFWLSSGSFHVWWPAQTSPSTPWEGRVDALMQQMVTTFDEAKRVSLFANVQREFAAARPVLYFAAPRVVIATSPHVGGAHPGLLPPAVLWDAEHLTSTRP